MSPRRWLVIAVVAMIGCGGRSQARPVATSTGTTTTTTTATATATATATGAEGAPVPTIPDPAAAAAVSKLEAFVAAHPDHATLTPDALVRLGSLYLDVSDAASVAADREAFAARARLHLIDARTRFPAYAHVDMVRYLEALAARAQGDRVAASAAFVAIIAMPGSPLVAEASLRLGDLQFEDGALVLAAAAYQVAASDPRFTAIATYKLGWCHWRREAYGEAVPAFQAVVEHAATWQDAARLVAEARQYLAMALVELDWDGDGQPDPGRGRATAALVRLADFLAASPDPIRRDVALVAIETLLDEARFPEAIAAGDLVLGQTVTADQRTRALKSQAEARRLATP